MALSGRPLLSALGWVRRGCERLVVEWECEWSVPDTRDRSPGHVGREKELEGEVREDEEGGMLRVDEP